MCKIGCAIALGMLCSMVSAKAGVETELLLAAAFTSVDDVVYGGLGAGLGVSYSPTTFNGGAVELRMSGMPVFSTYGGGLDVSQIHVPLTVALTFMEPSGKGRPYGLGGSIAVGAMATLGRFTSQQIALQPCATIDLTFGLFERGALKIRYTVVLGDQINNNGNRVTYQSLAFVGSTSW